MGNSVTVTYRLGIYGFVPSVFLLVSLIYSWLDHIFKIRYGYFVIVLLFIPLFIQCFRYINKKYALIISEDKIEISGEKIIRALDIKKIELRYESSLYIYVSTKNLLKKIVHLQVDQSEKDLINHLLQEWSAHNNTPYQKIS